MNKLRFFAVSLLFVGGIAAAAQAGPGHISHDKSSHKTERKAQSKITCPVTRESVKISKNTPVASYKGKLYFLCCDDCKAVFNNNPEKFTAEKKSGKNQ